MTFKVKYLENEETFQDKIKTIGKLLENLLENTLSQYCLGCKLFMTTSRYSRSEMFYKIGVLKIAKSSQ